MNVVEARKQLRIASDAIAAALAALDGEQLPPQPPQPAHRHGVALWFSDRPADYPELAGKFSAVRGWISLAPDGTVKDSDLAGAKRWRQAGFLVIACIHPSQASSVKPDNIEKWAAHLVLGADGINAFEIGNELDLGSYWPGGAWKQAVNTFVGPMVMELRSRLPQHPLILPALGNIAKQQAYEGEYAATLDSLRKAAQFQAIHPYSTTAADLESKVKRMQRVYNAPLFATEWDIGRGMDDSRWFADIGPAIKAMRQLTAVDCFYRIKDGNSADVAGRNLYDASGKLTAYGRAVLASL